MRGAVLGIVAGVSSVGVARRVTAEQTGPPDVVMIFSNRRSLLAQGRRQRFRSRFVRPLISALPPYDDSVKQIPCVCGYVVKGEDDDELWKNAQEHLREDHPDLTGKVSREDLLAQAEEVSRPKS